MGGCVGNSSRMEWSVGECRLSRVSKCSAHPPGSAVGLLKLSGRPLILKGVVEQFLGPCSFHGTVEVVHVISVSV